MNMLESLTEEKKMWNVMEDFLDLEDFQRKWI